MEASTFWKVSILLTVVGSAYSGIQYYRNIEQAKTDAQELKLQLAEIQIVHDARKAEWAAYEALQAKATEADAKTAPLKKQKEELESKLQSSELEFKNLAKSTRDAVEKVRADASSLIIPELKLADGRVLKDAKIRTIEDTQVSFTHADGVGVVPVGQLPPEAVERLDIGGSGIAKAITLAESDIFAGITRVAGISLKCHISLTEKPYQLNLPVVLEARQFSGKTADEMEVSIASIRYAKGTTVDLNAALAGSMKSVASLEGMTNPQQQVKDVTVSNFPAKRASFSAKRFGGELFAESLYLYNGETMWLIQVIFTNKSKGASPVAEGILSSVKIESAP